MKKYHNFIKSEYERIFGKETKHKIGDKIKIERMTGGGIATITFAGVTNKNPWFNVPIYRYDVKWRKTNSISKDLEDRASDSDINN